jgi:hypothetical protein
MSGSGTCIGTRASTGLERHATTEAVSNRSNSDISRSQLCDDGNLACPLPSSPKHLPAAGRRNGNYAMSVPWRKFSGKSTACNWGLPDAPTYCQRDRQPRMSDLPESSYASGSSMLESWNSCPAVRPMR